MQLSGDLALPAAWVPAAVGNGGPVVVPGWPFCSPAEVPLGGGIELLSGLEDGAWHVRCVWEGPSAVVGARDRVEDGGGGACVDLTAAVGGCLAGGPARGGAPGVDPDFSTSAVGAAVRVVDAVVVLCWGKVDVAVERVNFEALAEGLDGTVFCARGREDPPGVDGAHQRQVLTVFGEVLSKVQMGGEMFNLEKLRNVGWWQEAQNRHPHPEELCSLWGGRMYRMYRLEVGGSTGGSRGDPFCHVQREV